MMLSDANVKIVSDAWILGKDSIIFTLQFIVDSDIQYRLIDAKLNEHNLS